MEPLTAEAAGFASVDECRLVSLRTVEGPRGGRTIEEAGGDKTKPNERGEQVLLDDGAARRRVRLDDPRGGLHSPPGVWRELDSFTDGAVCVVLASMPYDDADYERDYEEFLNWRSR